MIFAGQPPHSDKSTEIHPNTISYIPRVWHSHLADYPRVRLFSQDYHIATLELLKNCTDPIGPEEMEELSSYIISVLLGDTLSDPERRDALIQLLLYLALFDKARAEGLVLEL